MFFSFFLGYSSEIESVQEPECIRFCWRASVCELEQIKLQLGSRKKQAKNWILTFNAKEHRICTHTERSVLQIDRAALCMLACLLTFFLSSPSNYKRAAAAAPAPMTFENDDHGTSLEEAGSRAEIAYRIVREWTKKLTRWSREHTGSLRVARGSRHVYQPISPGICSCWTLMPYCRWCCLFYASDWKSFPLGSCCLMCCYRLISYQNYCHCLPAAAVVVAEGAAVAGTPSQLSPKCLTRYAWLHLLALPDTKPQLSPW